MLYLPATHSAHCATLVRAVDGPYRPSGHTVHSLALTFAAPSPKRPAGQPAQLTPSSVLLPSVS